MKGPLEPISLILKDLFFPIETSKSSLIAVLESSNIFWAVSPPKSSTAMPPAILKFALIQIAFKLIVPSMRAPTIFAVVSKLSQVIISSLVIELSMALSFAVDEGSHYHFIARFWIQSPFAPWSVLLGLADIYIFRRLEQFRFLKAGFKVKHHWTGIFDHQHFFNLKFCLLEFSANEMMFIRNIFKVGLRLLICFIQWIWAKVRMSRRRQKKKQSVGLINWLKVAGNYSSENTVATQIWNMLLVQLGSSSDIIMYNSITHLHEIGECD